MTQNPLPLERCIEHFVQQVPVPEAGGAALSIRMHEMMDPILLARPRLQGVFMCVFAYPHTCLWMKALGR